jgi:hypothetical protein
MVEGLAREPEALCSIPSAGKKYMHMHIDR